MWIVGVVGLVGAVDRRLPQFPAANADRHGQPGDLYRSTARRHLVEIAIPFVIFAFHKKSWKAPDSDFEPFDWQTEGRTARSGLEAGAPARPRTSNRDSARGCREVSRATRLRGADTSLICTCFGCLIAAAAGTSANAQQPDSAAQSQWFTGSLVAPSPALSTAGGFEVEPYVVYTGNTGSYAANWSHHSVAHDLNEAQSETLVEYGITDRLSIQAVPSLGALWTGQNSSFGAGDLPVELKYRFVDQNVATGAPSVTVSLGMNFPLGEYDRLTIPSVGQGSGAFTVKQGILLQSLFDTWGDHPLRLRLYADAFEPLADASVRDISVYGTAQGFHGHATPGFAADTGLGVEYGLSQRWVLALDLVQNYSNTTVRKRRGRVGRFHDIEGPGQHRVLACARRRIQLLRQRRA